MPNLIEVESPLDFLGRMIGPKSLPAIAALMGALVFSGIIGIMLVDPGSSQWLVNDEFSTSYLGWLFFRHAPWSWPLGAVHSTGLGDLTSLVSTGSLPAFAFLFKLLSRWLPIHFQYFGFWLLTCYVLQGYFACRLLALFTQQTVVLLGGALLLLLSPIMLMRAQTDISLTAHWLVLAALYLYYAAPDDRRPRQWLVLLWLAILVQGYLALMVFSIWLAHLFASRALWRRAWMVPAAWVGATVAGLLVLMWLSGYFMLQPASGGNFSFYSMNAVAPFRPTGVGPFRMPVSAIATSGQYEGFNYLGLGLLIALSIGAAANFVGRRHKTQTNAVQSSDTGVIMVSIVLTVLALSNVFTFGSHRLLVIPLAGSFSHAMDRIGASGRLFWPAYYFLILAGLRGLSRMSARTAGALVLMAVVVQLVDLAPYLHATQKTFAARMDESGLPQISSSFWAQARSRYARLHSVAPDAADRDSVIGYRYIAGVDDFAIDPWIEAKALPPGLAAKRRDIEFLQGRVESGGLYLVSFATLHTVQVKQIPFPPTTGMGIVDGLAVIAPGWFDRANAGYLHRPGIIDYPPAPIDRKIGFSKSGDGALFCGQGWNAPEDEGRWSDGSPSVLTFHAPDVSGDLRVDFDVLPYLPAAVTRLNVDIKIDGRQLAYWEFVRNHAPPETTVVIPAVLLASGKNISLSFVFDKPRSPKETDESLDPRKLALFVRSMRFQDDRQASKERKTLGYLPHAEAWSASNAQK